MSDQLVRAISKDGFVKAAAVSTRALTERARQGELDPLIGRSDELQRMIQILSRQGCSCDEQQKPEENALFHAWIRLNGLLPFLLIKSQFVVASFPDVLATNQPDKLVVIGCGCHTF